MNSICDLPYYKNNIVMEGALLQYQQRHKASKEADTMG